MQLNVSMEKVPSDSFNCFRPKTGLYAPTQTAVMLAELAAMDETVVADTASQQTNDALAALKQHQAVNRTNDALQAVKCETAEVTEFSHSLTLTVSY